uniref:Uncharacterized protein n=1 Tax=Oryza punctata TaxID=4537 RepID=A0A0E0MJ14_ORYPU
MKPFANSPEGRELHGERRGRPTRGACVTSSWRGRTRERGVFNANQMVGGDTESGGHGEQGPVRRDWTESPELGPIGDLLASKDFQTTASVLVLQAYGRPPPVVGAGAGAMSVDFGGDSVAPTERTASGRRPWSRPEEIIILRACVE